MINTKELRFGSIVNMMGKPVVVTGTMGTVIYFGQKGIAVNAGDTFTPIELTPEILEKVGGKTNPTTYEIGEITVQWYDDTQKRVFINGNYMGILHLQYLHQLMNLYYALTGTDLSITL